MVGVAKHKVAHGVSTGVGSGRNSVAEVHTVYRVLQFAIVGSAYGSDGACANQLLSLTVVGQHEGCGSRTQLGVGLLDGEGGLLRVHVVALTGGGHLGGAGVHVVLEGEVIVGACGQDGVAVLHGNGRLLGQAVEDERLRVKCHSEDLSVGGHDAVLCRHAAGEVGRSGLGRHGGGVGAHVGLGVARHVIVLSADGDGAGADGGHLGRLLLLVIGEVVLGQGHRGQRSLGDAHLQHLRGHVLVVLVAHGLVPYGVLSGVQAGAHGRGVVHAVQRVLHLAALHGAGVQQRLGLGGIDQSLLHGRGGGHVHVGLQDVESLLGRARVVVVRGRGADGQRSRAGVHIVLIRHGVVRAGVQRHAVVGHRRGRLQGVARVGQVGDGANHVLGQFLRVDVERVVERSAEVVHTLNLHAGLARLGVVLVGGVVVAGRLVRAVVQTLNECLAVVGDDERGILRRAAVGDARHGPDHLAAQVARVNQEVGGQFALVLADAGHGELSLSGVHVVRVLHGVVHVLDECLAYVAHHHLGLLRVAVVDDGVLLRAYGVGRQSGDGLADAERGRGRADVVVVDVRLGRDDGRGGVHTHVGVVLVGHGVVHALSERVVAVGHHELGLHGAAGPRLVGNGVNHVVGQCTVGIGCVHLHVVGRHGERIHRVHSRRHHRHVVHDVDGSRCAARGLHAAERRIGACRHAVAHVALAGFHYYRHHVALIGGVGVLVCSNLERQRAVCFGTLRFRQVVGARGHGHRGQCEQCKNFLFHILYYFNVFFSNLP